MNENFLAIRALNFVSACLFMIATLYNYMNGSIRLGIGTIIMVLVCTVCGFLTDAISTAR